MSEVIDITKAAKLLGVCTKTLKRWEAAGRITCMRTITGRRRYVKDDLLQQVFHNPSFRIIPSPPKAKRALPDNPV